STPASRPGADDRESTSRTASRSRTQRKDDCGKLEDEEVQLIPAQFFELFGGRVSGMMNFREEGACREEIALYGGADSLRAEAAGAGDTGRGDLSQDGHRPGNVLRKRPAKSSCSVVLG